MKHVGRNDEVPVAWKEGREFRSGNGNFHTDGKSLYSYELRIGYTGANGVKYLVDYTWPNNISPTTTQHVGEARYVILQQGEMQFGDDGIYWDPERISWTPRMVKADPKLVEEWKRRAQNRGAWDYTRRSRW